MTLSFHIRHEVRPERSKNVLVAIAKNQTYNHIIQYDRQEARLRQLGFLTDKRLTETGQNVLIICERKPDLWGEIFHYQHYTLWHTNEPEKNGFSWTYRNFVNYLWETGHFETDNASLEPIVLSLINKVETEPAFEIEQTHNAVVSLGWRSLRGAYHWLEALVPPVIENETFNRRYFCPPELALLASGWTARQMDGEIGIDYLLTPERRNAISRLCLLDPSALDKVLDWMLPNYPNVVQPGTSAGTYGRFLRFLKWPEISDLLP